MLFPYQQHSLRLLLSLRRWQHVLPSSLPSLLSAEGGLYQDSASLIGYNSTSSPAVTTTFGVVASFFLGILTPSREQGTWDSNTDGLLGLAYSNLYCSPTCHNTILDDLYARYASDSYKDQFGLCLSEEKGILSLGTIDSELVAGEIHWLDVQNPAFYSISLTKFRFGSEEVTSVLASFLP